MQRFSLNVFFASMPSVKSMRKANASLDGTVKFAVAFFFCVFRGRRVCPSDPMCCIKVTAFIGLFTGYLCQLGQAEVTEYQDN